MQVSVEGETRLSTAIVSQNGPETAQLSDGARRLLDRLRWWKERFGKAFPSQRKLAAGLGVVVRTVQRWLAELVNAGLVDVARRYRRSNVYEPTGPKQLTLDFQPCEKLEEKPPERVANVATDVATVVTRSSLRSLRREMRSSSGNTGGSVRFAVPQKVRKALEHAWRRIQQARNPEAYAQRIIQDTLQSRQIELYGKPKPKAPAPRILPQRSAREALRSVFGFIPEMKFL